MRMNGFGFCVDIVVVDYMLLSGWFGFCAFWKIMDEYSWWFCVGVLNVLHFFLCLIRKEKENLGG